MQFSHKQLRPALLFVIVSLFALTAKAQQTATDFFKISSRSFEFKDYDNAIFFANKAIELNPNYGAAFWNLALAYDLKGDYPKALVNYTKAIKLYDNPKDLSALKKNRGIVYMTIKNYDSAIVDFTGSIEADQDNSGAWWNRAIAYDGLKKYGNAISDYSKTIELQQPGEDMAQVLIQRGLDYKLLDQKDKAEADFHKAIEVAPASEYYVPYAWYLLGNQKKAIDQINKSLAKKPAKPADLKFTYFNASCVYALMGNSGDAIKYMDLALKNGYNDFAFIDKDKDFDGIRDNESFKLTVNRYRPKQ